MSRKLCTLVRITLALSASETLKTSKPILLIKSYEELLAGGLDANDVGTNCMPAALAALQERCKIPVVPAEFFYTAGPNLKRGNTTGILATETLNGNIRVLKKVHNANTPDTALQSKHGFQPVLFGLSRISDLPTETEIYGLPYRDGRSLQEPFGRDRSYQVRHL